MKRIYKILIYIFVAITSFAFFLYLSFPYNVLKETIAVELSNSLGVSVSIKDLGPRLILGLNAEGVQIGSGTTKNIELKKVNAQLSLFYLLFAKIQVNVKAVDSSQGNLDVDIGFGIFDLIGGSQVPSSISVLADKFNFGNFVELALKSEAAKPETSPFIRPVLEKISVTGKLNAKVDFSLNSSDFSRSTGTINISLADAIVDFDPSMQIPSQRFESAVIKGSSQSGSFTFDPTSQLKTKDLDLAITGKLIEKTKIEQSLVDMEIKIQLFKELKNTFGVILNAVAGKDIDGKLNLKISGPVIPGPDFRIQ